MTSLERIRAAAGPWSCCACNRSTLVTALIRACAALEKIGNNWDGYAGSDDDANTAIAALAAVADLLEGKTP